MSLLMISETMQEKEEQLRTLSNEEKEFVVQFAFKTSDQELTDKLIDVYKRQDDKTPVIYESMTFANDRQKISLSVEKKDSETELPIAGAVFGLYADEDIVNIDGTVLVKAGELLETAESGTDGMITLTKDYPLGKYYAKEISAPAGYVSTEEVLTFDAEYQGQDVAVVKLTEECLNTPTTFEFTKTDITSGVEPVSYTHLWTSAYKIWK